MKRKWWKEGIVYQIYPRSFNDSNGDGIGDLKGLIKKLDYLEELGVTIIWLNPVYQSPNDDNGYDISDYQGVMDEFGTMEDWDHLLEGLHNRGIKLIMDLVVNHTSDEHQWFVESRKSKENPYRDYYIWRPGKDDKEPNNWKSFFSGPAWQYDEGTDEYYLHLFSKKQPDLNWENPRVRKEIYDMMTWWLDKGIDGFRMDVINMLSKVPGLPDADEVDDTGYGWGTDYFMNGPRAHEFVQEMNREVLSKYDIMTVGECGLTDTEEAIKYVAEERNELSMIFQMEHTDIDFLPDGNKWGSSDWKLTTLKDIMKDRKRVVKNNGWNSLFWMNHDHPRALSRFGNDKDYRKQSAKMLVTFLMTMQGTPYIYQGEEIGMTNIAFNSIDEHRDIETINYYNEAISKGQTPKEVMEIIHFRSRDNSRTPMQWHDGKNAGFTNATPWIKVNPNYKKINVEQEKQCQDSILNYYKEIIRFRKENLCFVYGDYTVVDEENEEVYAFLRYDENDTFFMMMNFTGSKVIFNIPDTMDFEKAELALSNYEPKQLTNIKTCNLKPYEARVYKLKQVQR